MKQNVIFYYLFDFRVGEDGPWDEKNEIITPTNDTKYYMENLLPFTSYSFRVSAVNARGRSAPSVTSHYITTLREGKLSPLSQVLYTIYLFIYG